LTTTALGPPRTDRRGTRCRFWTLETLSPDEEDFVTFGVIEPIGMVTREFVVAYGPERYIGRGPDRSYFVRDL
jgi:hypothetical protein